MANSKKTKIKAKIKKPAKKKKSISLRDKSVKSVQTKKSSAKPVGRKGKVVNPAKKTATEAISKKELIKKLVKDKANLLSDVTQKIKSESNPLKFEIGDIYDISSNERERELTLMLGDMEREKLFAIEEALERIKNGIHATCDNCGEPIGKARLMALPFTKVCIECKSKDEREKGARKHYEEEGGLAILEKTEPDEEEF